MAVYGGVEFPEPEIRTTNFELARVLSGHPMAFQTTDGQKVTIRLATAEEVIEQVRQAQENLSEQMADQPGWEPPGPMPYAQAVQLTTPLPL